MSYCRTGWNSDVYMFASIDGDWECCACRLEEGRTSRKFYSRQSALDHLYLHRNVKNMSSLLARFIFVWGNLHPKIRKLVSDKYPNTPKSHRKGS